jgi:hypothetical protein
MTQREKAKIHRSHERVFNGLVVGIYTMWFMFHHYMASVYAWMCP